MADEKFKSIVKVLEILKKKDLKEDEKSILINQVFDLYVEYDKEVSTRTLENQNPYGLFQLSGDIFELGLEEIDEIYEKDSEEEFSKGLKFRGETTLYYFALEHIKNCAKKIDNSRVPWVPFILKALQKGFIRQNKQYEIELTGCVMFCISHFKPLGTSSLMKKLWNHIWKRVAQKPIDSVLQSNYMNIAIGLMENVEICVLEETSVALVKTVVNTLKESSEKLEDREFWSHSRKHSYALIYSFVVKHWGRDSREFLISEIFDFVSFCSSVIHSKKDLTGSETYYIHLLDDFLSMLTADSEYLKSLPDDLRCNARDLAHKGIADALKIYLPFSNLVPTQPEIIKMVARMVLAERELSNSKLVDIFELASLKYGEDIFVESMKINSWNLSMRIMTEVISSGRLNPFGSKFKKALAIYRKRKCKIILKQVVKIGLVLVVGGIFMNAIYWVNKLEKPSWYLILLFIFGFLLACWLGTMTQKLKNLAAESWRAFKLTRNDPEPSDENLHFVQKMNTPMVKCIDI